MKVVLTAIEAGLVGIFCFGLIGCGASSVPPMPQRHALAITLQENSGLSDEHIRENPNAFAIGNSRHQVIATMGEPNRSNFGEGEDDEIYAFHSDGSKFVNSQVSGRVAMAALTVNPHNSVRPPAHTAAKMTIYHVYYSMDGTVEAVRKVAVDDPTAMRDDPEQDSRVTE